jgi:hypothetical protein
MRWSILGVLVGSLLVSACGATHAQEPRPGRYVIERPATTAAERQPMVMWVLDTATGEVAAYTAERENSRPEELNRLEIIRLERRPGR